jgi:hypothetical protein
MLVFKKLFTFFKACFSIVKAKHPKLENNHKEVIKHFVNTLSLNKFYEVLLCVATLEMRTTFFQMRLFDDDLFQT